MSARMQILEYLFKNNLTTLDELQAGLSEPNRKRLMDNVKAAIDDGLVDRIRDDVTNQPAYQLTGKGALVASRFVLCCAAAVDHLVAVLHPGSEAEAAEARIDVIAQNGNDGLHYEDVAPAADPALLAAANKMLSEKVEQLESSVETLRDNITGMLSDWTDIRQALDVATHEEALQAIEQLNRAYEERTQLQLDRLGKKDPIGYACMVDEATILPTESAAMDHALRVMREGIVENLHVVAIINTAEISVKWARP